MTKEEIIRDLLSEPNKLLQKAPFYREVMPVFNNHVLSTNFGEKITAEIPIIRRQVISQSRYLRELSPMSHDVMFDENIPSVCVKVGKDNFREIKDVRIPLPYQQTLRDKHVLHLCANPMDFTLLNTDPDEQTAKDFITFKQYWQERNFEGLKTAMVSAQESVGDAGMLFYYDSHGSIKARVVKYPDYTIITHKDDNGEHILECLYYAVDGDYYIDCYDDKYLYRITSKATGELAASNDGWVHYPPVEHGFSECPLITKRGKVAWDNVQTLIEMYETLYNIYYVIEKRHGWGILWIKGKFKDTGKRLAGNVILNDTSIGTDSDAKYLTPPTGDGQQKMLESLFDEIQIGAGATILLPKDVKTNGDVSGIAIQLTQSRDIETALAGVIEWQNVANKMCRLFKEGLSKELVRKGIDKTATTRFAEKLHISAKFKIWRPYSETEYNNMLISLKAAGLLSTQTGVEMNTVSKPDEHARVNKEAEENMKKQLEVAQKTAATNTAATSFDKNLQTSKEQEGE